MDLETLRVKILATNRLSEELNTTAFAADRVAESMQDGAVSGAELASGLSLTESEATDAARALGAANRQLAEGAAEGNIYAEGLSEAVQEQAEASAAAALLEDRLERVGDEATQSAAQMGVFGSAADSAAASNVRASFAGLSGTLTKIGAAAAAATPPLLAMGAGLTGIAGFGGIGTAGALGFTAAGIQSRAEEMAAFSEELESASDAREQLMEGFMGDLESATEALQTPAAEQFAVANMQAVVDVAEDASDALANVQPTIFGVAGGLREAFVATSPELFAELGEQTEALAPMFSRLEGTIQRLPALIEFLGNATQRIGPDLFTFGSALVEVGSGVTQVGIAVSDVLLPPLSGLLFLAGGVLGVFQALPAPLQNAAAAFALIGGVAYVAAGGLGVYTAAAGAAGTATGILATSVTILGGALTAPIWAIAALGAGAVALASHFGLLDDAVRLVTSGWNFLVEAVEAGVNAFLFVTNAIGDFLGPLSLLIPGIGPVIYVISHWSEIMRTAGNVVDWLGDKVRWLAKQAEKYLGPVIDLIGKATDRMDEAGGVELDAAKVGGDGDDSGDDGSGSGDGGSDGQPPAPPAAGAPTTGSGDGVTVDMSNSEFGGSTSKSDVKQWVKEGVQEANKTSRRREDAQGG